MADHRIERLAHLLTRYSVKLKRGDVVAISGHAIAAPLIRACFREALACGAHPVTHVSIDGLGEIFYQGASPKQLTWVSPFERLELRKVDATIGIMGQENTKSLTAIDPKRIALAAKAGRPLNKIFMDRSARGELRWVGTQWPCPSSAQDAEMSVTAYEDFVYGAGHLDERDPTQAWRDISKSQQALVRQALQGQTQPVPLRRAQR